MSSPDVIHVWSHCHNCGLSPIIGPCFRCGTCPLGPDIDLCITCYEGYRDGWVVHPDEAVTVPKRGTHKFVRQEGTPAERLAPWLNIPRCAAPSPAVPSGFMVRPEFRRLCALSLPKGPSHSSTISGHVGREATSLTAMTAPDLQRLSGLLSATGPTAEVRSPLCGKIIAIRPRVS